MPHIHEKIDFCVEVFIVHNNKVLLRLHDKYNKWLSVGGHIELNEDPNEAAIREVKEEVGLDIEIYSKEPLEKFDSTIKTIINPEFTLRQIMSKTHEHIILVYFATTKNPKLTLSKKEKSAGTKWFTFEELTKNKDIPIDIALLAKKALITLKK